MRSVRTPTQRKKASQFGKSSTMGGTRAIAVSVLLPDVSMPRGMVVCLPACKARPGNQSDQSPIFGDSADFQTIVTAATCLPLPSLQPPQSHCQRTNPTWPICYRVHSAHARKAVEGGRSKSPTKTGRSSGMAAVRLLHCTRYDTESGKSGERGSYQMIVTKAT